MNVYLQITNTDHLHPDQWNARMRASISRPVPVFCSLKEIKMNANHKNEIINLYKLVEMQKMPSERIFQ